MTIGGQGGNIFHHFLTAPCAHGASLGTSCTCYACLFFVWACALRCQIFQRLSRIAIITGTVLSTSQHLFLHNPQSILHNLPGRSVRRVPCATASASRGIRSRSALVGSSRPLRRWRKWPMSRPTAAPKSAKRQWWRKHLMLCHRLQERGQGGHVAGVKSLCKAFSGGGC